MYDRHQLRARRGKPTHLCVAKHLQLLCEHLEAVTRSKHGRQQLCVPAHVGEHCKQGVQRRLVRLAAVAAPQQLQQLAQSAWLRGHQVAAAAADAREALHTAQRNGHGRRVARSQQHQQRLVQPRADALVRGTQRLGLGRRQLGARLRHQPARRQARRVSAPQRLQARDAAQRSPPVAHRAPRTHVALQHNGRAVLRGVRRAQPPQQQPRAEDRHE
eukprot:366426-Chlamydomonas_euryale.AAC.8